MANMHCIGARKHKIWDDHDAWLWFNWAQAYKLSYIFGFGLESTRHNTRYQTLGEFGLCGGEYDLMWWIDE